MDATATSAFVAGGAPRAVRLRGARAPLCARPAGAAAAAVRAARRRAPLLCLATGAKPAEAAPGEGEEVLDETAMRAAEIHEVLAGLEEFKMRIVDDATKLAKKVRAPKKQLESALANHPDILKIDGHIAELQKELKDLGDR